jgi:hypothetical protein
VSVACPARYVDAVEGLIEEGTKLGEGWEDEWVRGEEVEVCLGVGFEAELERLFEILH